MTRQSIGDGWLWPHHYSSQDCQSLIQARHMGRVIQPARDTGRMWQRQQTKDVPRAFRRTEAPHEIGQGYSPRRRIEALRGQSSQRDDDLRPHQRNLPVQMPRAERDLPGGRRTIPLRPGSSRRTREALGQAGQVEVAMERLRREAPPARAIVAGCARWHRCRAAVSPLLMAPALAPRSSTAAPHVREKLAATWMKPASTQRAQAAISRCTVSSAACAWLVTGIRFRWGF